MFSNAVVRPPGPNFADGLTTGQLGPPIYDRALEQHERYSHALEECGLAVTRLDVDVRHPDSTFVEDVAIVTKHRAILTRPGAVSRQGEVHGIVEPLLQFYRLLDTIEFPGTLDGGDVCEVGNHFFIGISERTNEEGARQLSAFLAREGYGSTFVDVRSIPGILHLKSGIAWLGDNRLLLVDALASREEFRGYEIVRVPSSEEYAANCVRVNDSVLFAAGFPVLERMLKDLGFDLILLDMSEFRKMEGGLSCLSLRF